MKNRMAGFGIVLWLGLAGPVNPALATDVQLHIPPLFQERPDWCWAAVGEMLFKYYDVPSLHQTDYQCGIAQSRNLCKENSNCLECALPATDGVGMVTLLERYPSAAKQAAPDGTIALTARSRIGRLFEEDVRQELDAGRPIMVGLSPSGFKVDEAMEHLALIVGYKDGSDDLTLIVNDPFPFEDDRFLWIGNPYVKVHASAAGDAQYEIGYDRFRGRLKWTHTIYQIACTGAGCPPDRPPMASGSSAKDDRDVIQTVLAASDGDFQTLRTGHKASDPVQGTTWRSSVVFAGAKQCLVRDKDDRGGAQWQCTFKFDDREDAEQALPELMKRLHKSLPEGWTGTDLDVDTDSELSVTTDKFAARKPGAEAAVRLYLTDIKKNGRITIYLSVER